MGKKIIVKDVVFNNTIPFFEELTQSLDAYFSSKYVYGLGANLTITKRSDNTRCCTHANIKNLMDCYTSMIINAKPNRKFVFMVCDSNISQINTDVYSFAWNTSLTINFADIANLNLENIAFNLGNSDDSVVSDTDISDFINIKLV